MRLAERRMPEARICNDQKTGQHMNRRKVAKIGEYDLVS